MQREATSTAVDRYIQLEHELVQLLTTEQLEELHQALVKLATDVALERRNDNVIAATRIVLLDTVVFVLLWTISDAAKALSVVSLFNSIFIIWHGIKRGIEFPIHLTAGIVFSSANGQSFSVHQFYSKADDPDALRYWREVRDGMHGPIAATVSLLTPEQKDILSGTTLWNRAFESILGATLVALLFAIFALPWAIYTIINEYLREERNKKQGIRGIVDPDRFCYTDIEPTIRQTIDARRNQPNRRL